MNASGVAPGFLLVLPWDLDELGGVTQVVLNLARDLGSLGWAPTILTTDWSARAPTFYSDQEHTVIRWRIRSPSLHRNRLLSLLIFLVTLPKFAWTWGRLARRHNFRIVDVHYPDPAAFMWVALRRLRLWRGKVLLSIHGGELREAMRASRLDRWLMRRLLVAADAVVTPSAELAEEVARLAPRAREARVIPNGVNAERLRAELDPTFTIPREIASCRFVLNIATFEHKKSQDVLIDAFVLVAARHPDVHLVLVGRSTPWVNAIRHRAAASPVADRVHLFVDVPHSHIPGFLAHGCVFCLPSRLEGHPVAILEAAVYGLPVVATAVGGIPDTIRDEHHGLLVPVDDVAALASALQRLLDEEQFAHTIGRALQHLVQSEFRSSDSAMRYGALARQQLGEPL